MQNRKKPNILEKISVTLICVLASAGIIFFTEAIKGLDENKVSQILWVVFFGIAFAYYLGYRLEITDRFKFRKKP